ncbi:hypothetical protein ACS0TY_015536 [Phlomoides rotata]
MHPTTTMSPPAQNPTDSNKTTHSPESENPPEPNTTASDVESIETLPTIVRSCPAEPNKRKEEKKEEEETVAPKSDGTVEGAAGREKLKRHRVDVAGRVWVPDMWDQEVFLKDWADCASFDASLVNSSIVLARDSLMVEGRRANSSRLLRIQNGC